PHSRSSTWGGTPPGDRSLRARFGPCSDRRANATLRKSAECSLRPVRNAYGLRATAVGGELTPGAPEYGDELSRAPCDPLVHLVEYLAALIHRIPDRPRIHWRRVQVPEDQHVARQSPEALADDTALTRVHHHDEIGGADQLGGHEARPVRGGVHAVALG